MRLRVAVGEAVRNLFSAVTPWWLVLPIFVLLVGGPVLLRVSSAKSVLDRAERNASLGVNALLVQGRVDGSLCESLAVSDRYRSSGATRSGDPIVLVVEPRSPVAHVQVTPGAAPLYGVADVDRVGVHLSTGLADELGHPRRLDLTSGTADIAGTFVPPDHVTDFDRLVLEVVPALGQFDACLVDRVLAGSEDAVDVSRVVNSRSLDGMTISQLNADFGTPIDGRRELSRGSSDWVASLGAIVGGLGSAVLAVRLRRREIALQRHLGATRMDVAIGHALEAAVWSLIGSIVIVAGVVILASRSVTAGEARFLWAVGARGIGLGVLAAVLGGAAAAYVARAGTVLRYLGDPG